MKKVAIFISVFAIIAVGITAGLIYSKKSNRDFLTIKSGDSLFVSEEILNNEKESEKTIDLWSTYNQNDLVIDKEELVVDERNASFEVPQIRGLKNKNIEIKVNDSIKEKIRKTIIEFVPAEGVANVEFYDSINYVYANFSNIISFSGGIKYRKNDDDLYNYHYQNLYFNYELVNGEELQFKDLFKKDEDITTIVRMALYKYNAINDMWGFDNPQYDKEKNVWTAEYHWYDEQTNNEKSEIRDYIPNLTDYEIEKLVRKFIKNGAKSFYFTPYYFEIEIDNISTRFYLKDIAEKVVIYSKYLTEDSIYQEENVGAKNIITCSAEREFSKYKETKFETDNFFYDLDVSYKDGYYGDNEDYPARRFLQEKLDIEILKAKKKIREYKEIADAHKDKAFIVITRVKYRIGMEYESGKTLFYNILSTELQTKLFTCNIDQKEEVMNKIFNNSFRYYNFSFYGDAYGMLGEYTIFGDSDDYKKIRNESGSLIDKIESHDMFYVEEKEQKHIYDVLTGKEINSIEEFFIDGIDYKQAIKDSIRYGNEIKDDAKFILYGDGVEIDEGDEYNRHVDFSYIKQYVKIKELKDEILPSSTRIIDRYEIEEMDKEELEKAYNEIFARHGHDFKNADLKRYFSLWNWYEPITGKSVSMEELSEIETANANLIRSVIDVKGDGAV